MKKLSTTIFVMGLVLGLSTQSDAINGTLIDAQGGRIMGMGATNIAVTDGSNSIANNPGAIFAHDKGVIDMNIGLLAPHPDFENTRNKEDGQKLLCPLLSASFLSTPLNDNFKLGFGVFPIGGLSSEYRLEHAGYGDQVYESSIAFLKILPAVGYEVSEKLSVGLSFGVGYQDMRLKMPYQVHSGALAGAVMVADIRMQGADYSGNLGILYKATNAVKIGLVYKSPSKIDLSGNANVDASALMAGTAKYDVDATYKWPQSAGAGISYLATSKLLVAADIEWINWKKAMDTLEIKFSKGNSGLLPPALNDELPLNWDDQYVFRLGVEYKTTDNLDLRCGVSYGKSPIPDSTVMPVLCTITEWSATIGLGYNAAENISFNASYLHSFDHTQSPDVSLIGDEYDDSSIGLSIDAIYMGLTVKF